MPEPSVAYVLKGYPRLSETFIASEIHRLERAGLTLRLYVIKPRDEEAQHPVVDRIRARPEYLPPTTPLSGTPLRTWLRENLPAYLPALRRTLRRRPGPVLRAAGAAASLSLRARPSALAPPRKVFVKEFLQGAALADRLLDCPDVRHLHAHFAHGSTTVAWFASTITGIPFSFTGHAKDIYAPSLNPAGLLRRKLLAARFAVTCTEANRRHLQAIAPEARVYRIYHGLNDDFAPLLAGPLPHAASNGRFRLLAVGRLVEKKGFDVLVDACALLRRRGVPLEALIVGEDGDRSDEVRRRIVAHGLHGHVRVHGPMMQEALLPEYRRASVFALPCRVAANGDRDGIPNVLVEAMASGVPVVTTPVSGIPELVADGANGLLVPPDDPKALADALARVHHDAELARKLVDGGRATVRERFDGDHLARELAALFREVQ